MIEAARAADVSESTVYRRLRTPDFRKSISDARAEMVAQAVGRLSAASVEAADTLRALLSSEMDFARLAAARSILELGSRLREHEDLVSRIERLEARLIAPAKGETRW